MTEQKKMVTTILGITLLVIIGIGIGVKIFSKEQFTLNPESSLIKENQPEPTPLQVYSIPNLHGKKFSASTITIEKILKTESEYTAYLFSYVTQNKKMTGQLNIPVTLQSTPTPVIVLIRGYVPKEIYQTGVGTKNAAAAFAKQGYITFSPDFFGHGESDAEPEDSWQARFEKPLNVAELLASITQTSTNTSNSTTIWSINPELKIKNPDLEAQISLLALDVNKIGIWAHSNGGNIAVTTLEILEQPIPTTLWAPVTAPFPYSVLYFSDESEDEGKDLRKWLASFEKKYDVFDFTLTKHLKWLKGPIQIHHGTADAAAPHSWSEEFMEKIQLENKLRQKSKGENNQSLPPIEATFFSYSGADHNMQPGWNTAIERDIDFFTKQWAR